MKPGDKVEVVPSECLSESDELIGRRGVVVPIESLRIPKIVQLMMDAGSPPGHASIAVEFGDDSRAVVCITSLRKIDDDKPATWDGIEQLTGWKRPAVPA